MEVDPAVASLPSFLSFSIAERQSVFNLSLSDINYSAVRDGAIDDYSASLRRICISIAIPRGFTVAKGHSPYDILVALRDTLLMHYMRPLPGYPGKYVFLELMPDAHVLQQTLRRFTLCPAHTPHRPMSGNATGYVRSPRVEEISRDVQYPEFQNYREIIVSHLIPQSISTIRLTDIPRRPDWKLLINGQSFPWPEDTDIHNGLIKITNPSPDAEYENCPPVIFTMEQALEGVVEGVYADSCSETVSVSMHAMPVRKEIRVRLVAGRGIEPARDNLCTAACNVVAVVGGSRRHLTHSSGQTALILTGNEIGMNLKFHYNGPEFSVRAIRREAEIDLVFDRTSRAAYADVLPAAGTATDSGHDDNDNDAGSDDTEDIVNTGQTPSPSAGDKRRLLSTASVAFAIGVAAGLLAAYLFF